MAIKHMTDLERFMTKVKRDPKTGCWDWQASCFDSGYGQFSVTRRREGYRKNWRAHRFAYLNLVGPIPDGLVLDHLCRNTRCVNPDHLEPVTIRENGLRGEGFQAKNAAKTHCIRGHEFTKDNIYWDSRGRVCRECKRVRERRLMAEPPAERVKRFIARTHGLRTTYRAGCRCPECTAASTAYIREHRRKKEAA